MIGKDKTHQRKKGEDGGRVQHGGNEKEKT